MCVEVAGHRPPGDVFDDLVEEVSGILGRPLGLQPLMAGQHQTLNSGEIEADVHVLTQVQRKKSTDSIDLMIEEEIKALSLQEVGNVENTSDGAIHEKKVNTEEINDDTINDDKINDIEILDA